MKALPNQLSQAVKTSALYRYQRIGFRRVLFGSSSSWTIYLLFSTLTLTGIGFLGLEYLQEQTIKSDKATRHYQLVRTVFASETHEADPIYFSDNPVGLTMNESEGFVIETDNNSLVKETGIANFQRDAEQEVNSLLVPSKHHLKEVLSAPRAPNETGEAWTVTKIKSDTTIQSAYTALYNGDLSSAKRHFMNVLVLDPNNIYVLNGLAAVLSQVGMEQHALEIYQKVLSLDPTNLHALEAVFTILGDDLKGPEWKKELQRALSLHPTSATLNTLLGSFYARDSDWKSAQRHYFEAHSLDQQSVNNLVNLAISLDQLGQYTLAVKFYSLALANVNAQDLKFDVSQVTKRLRAINQFINQGEQ